MASFPPPHVVEEVPQLLQLLSDGTVIRSSEYTYPHPPLTPPSGQPVVQWKDVVYDASHDVCKLRVYKPQAASSSSGKKLPVIVYYHGGGYIMGSFDMPCSHHCCLRLAGELPAVVLSADYRFAPEHPLPAGLDDAATVLRWVRDQAVAVAEEADADPWLADLADFGRVFVAGDSAGGGVVHHTAVRLASGQVGNLDPVRIAGHVLLFPLFGGVERTASELELPPGPFVSLPVIDKGWRILLPPGSTRDHPFSNPFGPESPAMDVLALPPMLVVVAEYDLLCDRAADYVARLKAKGKSVELVKFEGQHHEFFSVEPYGDAGSEVVRLMKRFVYDDGAVGVAAVST